MITQVEITSHAKWILTGEHTVIRGGKAIVFPMKNYTNVLSFSPGSFLETLDEKVENSFQIISTLIDYASSYTRIPLKRFFGQLYVKNSIPIGRGLGSSAALCANIAKLSKFLGYQGDLAELGRLLENKFHKNSSGLDVAASLSENPIVFQNNKVKNFLNLKSLPFLTLTYSGKSSLTSMCVEKVEKLFKTEKNRAISIDKAMNTSAELCEEALKEGNIHKLADGINLGNEIFKAWDLYNDELQTVSDFLRKEGAIALKPIGSGLGGYVVGLWNHEPSTNSYDIRLTLESS